MLATDLGVIVKKGNNNQLTIAVSNIINTNSIDGAVIKLYNYQQKELATTRTNSSGIASIDLKENAYFAKVTHANQMNYIRLDDGNALSMSKFDTSGSQLEKGIKGYMYGDRGVWRPGDNIYFTFVLNDTVNKLPSEHPVNLKLRDPNGKLVHQETQKSGLNNFYQFDLQTDDNAITGNWNASVEVGGVTFNKTLKIENINTLF